jgi:hypothetical protein
MTSMAERVAATRERIAAAAARSGRAPASIKLVAAGKYADAEQILEAAKAGVTDVGENRAQDLRDKYKVAGDAVTWHFLGGLQTNKVRYLDVVSLVHSLDRLEEADALQRRGEAVGRRWEVLVEVNVSGDSRKQGIGPDEAERFVLDLGSRPLVRPRGLMVVGPAGHDPEEVRPVFARTRMLRDRLSQVAPDIQELSMGMTDDFEVAIEEGSTIVRIGRAIFAGGFGGRQRPDQAPAPRLNPERDSFQGV